MMSTLRRFLMILFYAGVIPLMGSEALAQSTGDIANLERELEATEMIIHRAAEMARDAGNAQAAELVKKAIEVQTQARQSFAAGRFAGARILTSAARKMAEKAIALMHTPDGRGDRVQAELERTDEFLGRAREHLDPSSPESAHSFLAAAQRQQENAWQLFRSSELRPALRMTLQVRSMLKKLAARLGDTDPDRLTALLSRVEALVEEASQASDNPAARRLAVRATEMLNRGKEFLANGQIPPARRHLEQAGRLARQSLRRGENNTPTLDEAVRRYEAMFDQVTELLSQNPNPAVEKLLLESREHLNLAVELAAGSEENTTKALAEMRLANRLLQQARRMLR